MQATMNGASAGTGVSDLHVFFKGAVDLRGIIVPVFDMIIGSLSGVITFTQQQIRSAPAMGSAEISLMDKLAA